MQTSFFTTLKNIEIKAMPTAATILRQNRDIFETFPSPHNTIILVKRYCTKNTKFNVPAAIPPVTKKASINACFLFLFILCVYHGFGQLKVPTTVLESWFVYLNEPASNGDVEVIVKEPYDARSAIAMPLPDTPYDAAKVPEAEVKL